MSDRCAQCLAAHERSLAELVARIAELEAQLQHLESWGYPDENNPWADLAEYFGLDEETVDGAEDVARYVMDRDSQVMERIERLEAERDDARKQNVALQRRLDLVDALSRNTDRIDRLILAAVLRTVGGRVEIPQEHLDAAGHTDFIVSAPTPDKLVVMIEQPEGPEGGDYGHL